MQRRTKYEVVAEKTLDAMMQRVNNLILDGWVCQGGVSVVWVPPDGSFYFYQALVY